jgi:hypothetical protein
VADDIAAAMVAAMDDDELAAHVAELRRLLAVTPREHPRNEQLIIAWGRACAAANARGIAVGDGQGDEAG